MLKFVTNVTLGIGVFALLIELIPYKLSLPSEFIEFIETNPLQTLFDYANYFFPIGFALKVLICLYLVSHLSLIGNLITWIYEKIVG